MRDTLLRMGLYFGKKKLLLPGRALVWLGKYQMGFWFSNSADGKEKSDRLHFGSLSPFLLRKFFWICIDRSVPKNFALFQLFEYLFHCFIDGCLDACLNDRKNHLFKLRLLFLFLALFLRCVVNPHFFTFVSTVIWMFCGYSVCAYRACNSF